MTVNIPLLDTPLPLAALLLFLPVAYLINDVYKSKSNVSLPPGPKPLPILGNILDINSDKPWVTYKEWAAIYGDLVYSYTPNEEIVTLNSEKLAKELLERRSYNYSDRPQFVTIDMCGWNFSSVFLAYTEKWRLHRRLFHQSFRADAALAYRPIQLRKVHQLLVNLLETPEDYADHFQTLSSAIIMEVTYGYNVAPRNDSLVILVEQTNTRVMKAISPLMGMILGRLPFLRRIPPWFPGASFKREALECQKLAEEMVELPFQYTKRNMAAGTAPPSMVHVLLSRTKEDDSSRELAIKHVSGSAVTAASETTSSILNVFLLAMVLHPDILRKAQLEIDTVISRDRLPDFSDRMSLPYIEAVYRETLRWYPVVPLGIPHGAINDDVFGGYLIPKGATVIANIWAMARDEERYPDASIYKPERYFTSDGKLNDDNVSFVFGFGRRVCVGRHFGDASVWAGIVSILAAFNIEKAKDERGNDVEVDPQWTAGIATHPRPFPCRITPRIEIAKLAHMMECHT